MMANLAVDFPWFYSPSQVDDIVVICLSQKINGQDYYHIIKPFIRLH